jgi:uncharacterized protein YjbJ (UPF0337 family)
MGIPNTHSSNSKEALAMGGETIRNKAEEFKGAAKEKFGEAIGDDSLQADGAAEKAEAKDKQWQEEIDKEVEEMNRP